jgi:hypothetical protein
MTASDRLSVSNCRTRAEVSGAEGDAHTDFLAARFSRFGAPRPSLREGRDLDGAGVATFR